MPDDRPAHLQMIQSVIARMASNSFALKGWSVSIAAALLAFAAGTKNQWIALVGLLPAVAFWALDGYYLALEQRFRDLYADVAKGTPTTPPIDAYSMDVARYAKTRPWSKAAFSASVLPLHGVTAAAVIAIAVAMALGVGARADEPAGLTKRDTLTVRVVPAPHP